MIISSIVRKEGGEWQYPCLGEDNSGTVVLFTEKGHGTLLKTSSAYPELAVGHPSFNWFMSCFKPMLKGAQVVLQNS
jgi:hypothetical protein